MQKSIADPKEMDIIDFIRKEKEAAVYIGRDGVWHYVLCRGLISFVLMMYFDKAELLQSVESTF